MGRSLGSVLRSCAGAAAAAAAASRGLVQQHSARHANTTAVAPLLLSSSGALLGRRTPVPQAGPVAAAAAAPFSTTSAVLKRPAHMTRKPGRTTRQGRHRYAGARRNRDNNPHRGESSVRGTGVRWRTSVADEPLPRPRPRDELPRVETDPDHGLWQFFADRTTVAQAPASDAAHGRAWTVEELRQKSWDDLHRLWWVCVKERNRIATATWERKAQNLGYGAAEADGRNAEVLSTMKHIKHVLTERYYVWEDAVKLAHKDPELRFYHWYKGRYNLIKYTPQNFEEDEEKVGKREKAKAKAKAAEAAEADENLPSAAVEAPPAAVNLTDTTKPPAPAASGPQA